MATPKPKARFVDFAEMLSVDTQQDTAPAPVQGGILEMDFSLMESFPNHRFKLYEGQQLTDMVDSIRQFGILLPIILWYTEDGRYIILSGHNRKNAAQLAGFTKGPVIIRENLTYEDAVLIVTETNLRQRSFSDMSYSERAYCLAQHYAALKSQGKRNDLLAEIEMLLNPHARAWGEGFNYRYSSDHHLYDGGAKTKFKNNIAAIRLLKELQAQGRPATAEEQITLARFVGWGGLANALTPDKSGWETEYAEIKELLTDEELQAAQKSTLTSYYTEQSIVNHIYKGLERMGFRGGNILDPALGTGNFFSILPDSMAEPAQ